MYLFLEFSSELFPIFVFKMKINLSIILIIIFINLTLLNFIISMKRKEPMGSLNKKETQSGTSTCQSPGKDDKIEKFSLQKGNKKIRKHFEIRKFPTVAIQNKLIEYYEHENPDFKIAKKQVDDGENRTNILDRIDGDELKVFSHITLKMNKIILLNIGFYL